MKNDFEKRCFFVNLQKFFTKVTITKYLWETASFHTDAS